MKAKRTGRSPFARRSHIALISSTLRTGNALIDLPKGETELPEKSGGLNWSVQHHLEVYLPEFESPKFVAGVD